LREKKVHGEIILEKLVLELKKIIVTYDVVDDKEHMFEV
jgi:hypothetical protein